MVCPNRLLALGVPDPTVIRHFSEMSATARYVLEAIGAKPGQVGQAIGAWSEISIKEHRGHRVFDYRFDFVLNPVAELTPPEFAAEWGVQPEVAQRAYLGQRTIFAPTRCSGFPIIVEVMTASTSGSNERQARGIAPAFYSAWATALEGAPSRDDAPGTNVRQVWGRMASQLIAKSEAGEAWGGRTIWLMQDKLLNYIRDTTNISESHDASELPLPLPLKGANIISFKFGSEPPPGETRPIQLDRYIADNIPSMFDNLGKTTMHGILHAPFVPEPGVMAVKLLQSQQRETPGLQIIILP